MPTSDLRLLDAGRLIEFSTSYLRAIGCTQDVAEEMAAHLVDADLCGVHSHGTVRLPQYAEQIKAGDFAPSATPTLTKADGGADLADAGGGFGVPACTMAVEHAVKVAKSGGIGACGVINAGHTGRIGAFAEYGGQAGCFTMLLGGGSRKQWRQVAPFGGAKAVLPTNPYAMAIPAGADGPVMIDFATSAAAGGKVLAARAAGLDMPPGQIIDAAGKPTVRTDDYINGGALLPAAGPKGYGMALIAELIGEAMFGEALTGMNWLVVCIDLSGYRAPGTYQAAASACLEELRACPPADGFDRVEIPGERERTLRAARKRDGIPMAAATIEHLNLNTARLGVAPLT
ncbi:MAG: Ldh family oxidoreductase [Pikeienuella sp.]